MGGGTEAFPDLGRHCQDPYCRQLDFLPFTCNACQKVYCLDHRSHKAHDCPKSDISSRKVVVCEICSLAIETTGYAGEDEKKILQEHEKSKECDPKKNKKEKCPVRRCKELLTFSNTATCKGCRIKVCLKHRFPLDHVCSQLRSPSALRNGKDCGKNIATTGASRSVNAY